MITKENYELFQEYVKNVPKDQIIGTHDTDSNLQLFFHEVELISKTYKIFYINML